MGGIVYFAAIAAQISVTQIIREHVDNINVLELTRSPDNRPCATNENGGQNTKNRIKVHLQHFQGQMYGDLILDILHDTILLFHDFIG